MSQNRIRQAVILVGGRGTRLGSITETLPKPLVPVADRPFLDWQIQEVARYGIEEIILLAGYKGEQIHHRYHGKTVLGCQLKVFIEPEPFGTAGALRVAQDHLDPYFYMMNGDTMFTIDMVHFANRPMPGLVMLALLKDAPGRRYGVVDCDAKGVVKGFLERSAEQSGPINGGIYVVDRALIAEIGPGFVSLEADIFPRLAAAEQLLSVTYDRPFLDIGIPEDMERAQTLIPEMTFRPALVISYSHPAELVALAEGIAHANGAYYVIGACSASDGSDGHKQAVNTALFEHSAHIDEIVAGGSAPLPLELSNRINACGTLYCNSADDIEILLRQTAKDVS